jgi:hypothetical protein
VAVVREPLDEPGAEEPAAAGDEHAAHSALRCFDARTGSAATVVADAVRRLRRR